MVDSKNKRLILKSRMWNVFGVTENLQTKASFSNTFKGEEITLFCPKLTVKNRNRQQSYVLISLIRASKLICVSSFKIGPLFSHYTVAAIGQTSHQRLWTSEGAKHMWYLTFSPQNVQNLCQYLLSPWIANFKLKSNSMYFFFFSCGRNFFSNHGPWCL